jgi:hypothetical protein
VLIQDQKASGTNGGSFTSGAWRTRDLNTIVTDSSGLSSLAANQITLAPGTYYVQIEVPGNQCNRHAARLQSITGGTTLLSGTGEFVGVVASSRSRIVGKIVLAASTVLEVQHRCQTTENGDGFGVSAGASFAVGTEVYTSAEFWKAA